MGTWQADAALGATTGTAGRVSEGADPFAAQNAARTAELPLAGRTMIDLGRQVAEWLARAKQAARARIDAALKGPDHA